MCKERKGGKKRKKALKNVFYMQLIIQSQTLIGLLWVFNSKFMMISWSSIISRETLHLPLSLGQNVGLGEGYVAISQNLTLTKAFLPLSLHGTLQYNG